MSCPWCAPDTSQLDRDARHAAIKGLLQMLKELHDQGAQMDNLVMLHAAAGGQVACMKFLYEDCNVGFVNVFALMPFHCTTDSMHLSCCTVAGAGGHLDAMKYAHARGALIDETTLRFVAKKCDSCYICDSDKCDHDTCFEYASYAYLATRISR